MLRLAGADDQEWKQDPAAGGQWPRRPCAQGAVLAATVATPGAPFQPLCVHHSFPLSLPNPDGAGTSITPFYT